MVNDGRFKKGHVPWDKGKKGLCLNTGVTHFKKGIISYNLGKHPSLETIEKMSISHLGKHLSEETKKNLSIALKLIKHKPPSHKGKTYQEIYGDRWQEEINKRRDSKIKYHDIIGRKTRRNHHTKNKQYILWRKSVFERDNYTCQMCFKNNTYIEAHHINSYVLYPESRYILENGITLCKECHKLTDNYAGRKQR